MEQTFLILTFLIAFGRVETSQERLYSLIICSKSVKCNVVTENFIDRQLKKWVLGGMEFIDSSHTKVVKFFLKKST